MKRAIVLLLVTCACACSKKKPEKHDEDPIMPPLRAALDAPEGGTPCESAYNGFSALDAAAKKSNMPPPWKTFPAKPDFLAACDAMPPDAQRCLVPGGQSPQKCTEIIDRVKQTPEGQRFYGLLAPP